MDRRLARVSEANKSCGLSSKSVATNKKGDERGGLIVISTAKCYYAVREVCAQQDSQEIVKEWFRRTYDHDLEWRVQVEIHCAESKTKG